MKLLRSLSGLLSSDRHLGELLKGGGISLLFRLLGTLGVYLFNILISKYYGPDGNGLYAFVWTIAIIISFMTTLGLNTYILKVTPTYLNEGSPAKVRWFFFHAFKRISLLSLLVGTFMYYIVPIALSYFDYNEYINEVKLAALLQFPLSLLKIIAAAFRGKKQITAFSLLQTNVIQSIAIILLIYLHQQLPLLSNPITSIFIVGILGTIVGLIGWHLSNPRNLVKYRSPHFGKMVKLARPMLLAGVVFFIMSWSDKIMLRLLYSREGLGIYEVAQKLASIANIGLLAVITIAEPKFAELYNSNKLMELKKFVNNSTLLSLLLNTPIVLLIICFANFWLGLFGSNGEYLVGKSTLIILGLAQLVTGLCGPTLNLLNMSGKERFVRDIILFTALMNIITNYLLIPRYGINGAAISTFIGILFWNVTTFIAVRRHLGFYPLQLLK